MDLVTAHGNLIFWMLIMFFIVLYILKKFAWKPILFALKERENSIKEALESAEKAKEEMANLKVDNEKIIAEAKKDRDKLLKEAKDLKDTIIKEAKEKATEETAKIVESARQNIHNEKKAAIEEMKNQIAVLSVKIAEKLITKNLSKENEQKTLVNDLLKDVKIN